MCVAAVALSPNARWRLVMAGNRDEYHHRPTAPLAQWDNGVMAGRDLQAGGTWLGAHESGRFALVTNFRVDGYPRPHLSSRGALVTDWLLGREPQGMDRMNPFNLLLYAADGAWHVANHPTTLRRPLTPGIHGLSNGGFDDRWAKTAAVEAAVAAWLTDQPDGDFAPLFDALRNETPLPDPGPVPGSGPTPEYTPVFIRNPVYGTRCSTVLAVDAKGNGRIVERRFDADGNITGESALAFRWP